LKASCINYHLGYTPPGGGFYLRFN